ncbi:MAG: glycoside hydrolase family 97 N-terminal domain-containing protein, partial [Thermoguttaceae bacterium]
MSRTCLFLSAVAGITVFAPVAQAQPWQFDSPGRTVSVTVALQDLGSLEGYSRGTKLYYQVSRKSPEGQQLVLPWSPLGITRADQSFVDGLKPLGPGELSSVEEKYTLLHGKRRECSFRATRQAIALENAGGARVEVEFHVADDGAAFRYRFPEKDPTPHTVVEEATGFTIPGGARAWIQPYQESTQWTPAYEEYFQNGVAAGTTSPTRAGWCLPALFQLPQHSTWVLLAEAAVDGTYCGGRLAAEAPGGHYRLRFPDPGEGNGVGAVEPSSTLPWMTPWRVIVVGSGLEQVV